MIPLAHWQTHEKRNLVDETCKTPSCLPRGTGGDRDPGTCENRETGPNITLLPPVAESRRDQEEGGELDSHEEARLSFASPGEIKRMEGVLDPQESPEKIKSRQVELGSESWTCLLLQLFLNSSATDIVLVTLLRTAVETAIA